VPSHQTSYFNYGKVVSVLNPLKSEEKERKREATEAVGRGVVMGKGPENYPALKVPKQCPFDLLAEVRFGSCFILSAAPKSLAFQKGIKTKNGDILENGCSLNEFNYILVIYGEHLPK
jgi:hypothetical protein